MNGKYASVSQYYIRLGSTVVEALDCYDRGMVVGSSPVIDKDFLIFFFISVFNVQTDFGIEIHGIHDKILFDKKHYR